MHTESMPKAQNAYRGLIEKKKKKFRGCITQNFMLDESFDAITEALQNIPIGNQTAHIGLIFADVCFPKPVRLTFGALHTIIQSVQSSTYINYNWDTEH